MAGGVFSTAKLFAMTIRESANDGSDFTNPDADYRRLFLGEDGLLHVKDSAGTVTSPYTGGVTLVSDKKRRVAGDVTLNAGSFALINSGLDITLTTGARRCLVTVTGTAFGSTAGALAAFDIQIDGVLQGTTTYGLMLISVDNKSMPISFSYITDTLTAASHTFKLYGADQGAGTATVYASDPALIFAVHELL